VGLKLIFLIVTRAVSVLDLSRREAWWKDAEILMLRHQLAVALSERPLRSFEVDVAGPGVAGPARREATSQPAGRDAGHRHSCHDLAVAPRHRSPPLGAPVAPRPTLIWNLRHLMMVLWEYEDFYNSHRPHRALDQAAPLRPLPDGITDLDHFRVRRHDRVGGVIHEYRLVA
jgi:hypothetical protein